jgi:peptidoglycan hydrolase-like protein with peptidoglycan-binding domain
MWCPVFIDNVGFKVTSPFGYRTHPVTEQPGTLHGGIDIVSEPIQYPTRIKPIAAGYIVAVKKDVKGYSEKSGETGGNYVYIMHDDRMETRYKHLAYGSIPESLNVGDYVTENDCIGHMGATGRVTGAHLHFEVCDWKVKGTEFLLDPYYYLTGAKSIQGLYPEGGDGMGYIRLTKELKYGDKGEDVKLLQWRLCQLSEEIDKEMKSHSFKKDGQPDGGFGRGTENTLKKVQRMAGLAETGKLDKQTLEFLNADFISLYKQQNAKVDETKVKELEDKITKLENEKALLEKAKADMTSQNQKLQQDVESLDKKINEVKGAIDILRNL